MQYRYIEKWKDITKTWRNCSSQELRILSSQNDSFRDSLVKYERDLQLFVEKLIDNITYCDLYHFINTYRDISAIISNCSYISSLLDQKSIQTVVQLLFTYYNVTCRLLKGLSNKSIEYEFLLRGQQWCISELDHYVSSIFLHEQLAGVNNLYYELLESSVSDSRDTVSTICQEFTSLHSSVSSPFPHDDVSTNVSPSNVFDWFSSLTVSFSLPEVITYLKSQSPKNCALLLDYIEECMMENETILNSLLRKCLLFVFPSGYHYTSCPVHIPPLPYTFSEFSSTDFIHELYKEMNESSNQWFGVNKLSSRSLYESRRTSLYMSRFILLEMKLVYDIANQEEHAMERIFLLLFIWGMNPRSLYSQAVAKMFVAIRECLQKPDGYSHIIDCCPSGFNRYKYCQMVVYLFLMDPRSDDLKVAHLLKDEEVTCFHKELKLLQMILEENQSPEYFSKEQLRDKMDILLSTFD